MPEEKIKIDLPIIVEGKYDKIKLASILDAEIITTDVINTSTAAVSPAKI